jgi:acyl-CoA thioesterase I
MKRKIVFVTALAMLACAPADEPPAVARDTVSAQPGPDARAEILFLGTSLTAGFGVGVENSFPALIQQKLDSAKLPYRVVNAGLSGETSAGGLRRLDWTLQQPIDVMVVELGANDGLRGLPLAQMRANLDSIMARARARYPEVRVVIAGMEAPPNLGSAYTSGFRQIYRELADKYDAVLIPFLLEGVATRAELNQEDGIHPNIEGHRIIAAHVWAALEPVLRSEATK